MGLAKALGREEDRLRRARRRADARVHLRTALDAFEVLGAVDWAATARGELGVTGETAAPRSGPRSDALTRRSSRRR